MRNYFRDVVLAIAGNAANEIERTLQETPYIPYNMCDPRSCIEMQEGSLMGNCNISGTVRMGRDSRMLSCSVAPGAVVSIGDNATVSGVTVGDGAHVTIGDACLASDFEIIDNSNVSIGDSSVVFLGYAAGRVSIGKRATMLLVSIDTTRDANQAMRPVSIGTDAVLFFASIRTGALQRLRYSLADRERRKSLHIGNSFTFCKLTDEIREVSHLNNPVAKLRTFYPRVTRHSGIDCPNTLITCAANANVGNNVSMSGRIVLNVRNRVTIGNDARLYREDTKASSLVPRLYLSADMALVRDGASIVSLGDSYSPNPYNWPGKLVIGEQASAILDSIMAPRVNIGSTVVVPARTTAYI